MGFFDHSNTKLETAWFSVLSAISFLCFPFGIKLARRFPQIMVVKFVPVLCLLLAYENIILALSNVLGDDSYAVKIGKTSRAAVIPVFLLVMFEVAYAVHKRRSVKFCGIVFDQGHRISVEPCSWFLRNFVRIIAVMLFVVGILVHHSAVVGNDDKAGGTGRLLASEVLLASFMLACLYCIPSVSVLAATNSDHLPIWCYLQRLVDTESASAHLLLALLPTTGMAVIALYIAIYMWKYGNDASIVVQSAVCNGWSFLFLGTLALLGGQVPPEWCFRVANESGQVLLLLSLIAIGREIGKEMQATDDFSTFLEKENELEIEGRSSAMTTAASAIDSKDMGGSSVEPNVEPVQSAAPEDIDIVREEPVLEEHGIAESPEGDRFDEIDDSHGRQDSVDRNLEDVMSSRERRAARSSFGRNGGRGVATQPRTLSGLFRGQKRGGSFLHSRTDCFGSIGEDFDGVGEVRVEPSGRTTKKDDGGQGLLHPSAGTSSSGAPLCDVTSSVLPEVQPKGGNTDRTRRRGVDVV